MQCPGCSNIFFSQKSLRVHLSEDHNVAKEELEHILSSFPYQSSNEREMKNQSDVESNLRNDEEQTSLNECSEEIILELDNHHFSNVETSEKQPQNSTCLKKATSIPPPKTMGKNSIISSKL